MEGNKIHRHLSNPKEKELHDNFVKHCSYNSDTMERISLPLDERGNPKGYISEREEKIVISTIQWLGSSVGKGFLKQCGFEEKSIK